MIKINSRQRILMALKRKEADRIPFFDFIDPRMQQKIMEKDEFSPIELAEKLQMDAIGFDLFPPLFCNRKEIDGIDHIIDGLIKKREDLKYMRLPDPYDDNLYTPAKKFVDKYASKEYAIYARIRLGASPTLLSMGMEGFSYALYDDPQLIDTVFDSYIDWCGIVVENLNEIGVDFIWAADDIAYKTGPMFSPKVFKEVFLPRMKSVANKIKLPWIYHSDGNLTPFLDEILTLGMSCLHPIEPGAMDIEQVKQQYGTRICIMGNIDLNYTLTQGSPENVENEVKLRIKQVGPGGGYILSSANSIPIYAKPENVLAMSQAVQKYGKYPLKLE